MKNLTLAVLLVLLVAVPQAFPQGLKRFAGPWGTRQRGAELERLRIHVDNEGSVQIQAYGMCNSGQSCDWGQGQARLYRPAGSSSGADATDAITVLFAVAGAEKLLVISPGPRGALQVEIFTHFTDSSGRPDYHCIESLHLMEMAARKRDGPEEEIPKFPWPPPTASASVLLPAKLLRRVEGGPENLDAVNSRLSDALATRGYVEKSYFAVPDGFAIVTRLEQINADGRPKEKDERWAPEIGPLHSFSLSEYISALFRAPVGHYRILVFVITSHPFSQSDARVPREEAMDWLRSGLNTLPPSIGVRPYTQDYACTALIYEFEQPGGSGSKAVLKLPSDVSGEVHLELAGIWAALRR